MVFLSHRTNEEFKMQLIYLQIVEINCTKKIAYN